MNMCPFVLPVCYQYFPLHPLLKESIIVGGVEIFCLP